EARVPARDGLIEIVQKTDAVGIAAMNAVALEDKGIGGPDLAGQRIHRVAELERRFLQRNGDVAADEFALAQTPEMLRQLRRSNVDGVVTAGNPMGTEPAAMDERGARMGDRMTDHESTFHVNPPRCSGAWMRRAARSGRSGK